MKYPELLLCLPLLALMLDLLLADPHNIPHPVAAIGWFLNKLAKKVIYAGKPKLCGAIAIAFCVGLCMLIAELLIHLPGILGFFAALYLSYAGLALGGLLRSGKRAVNSIKHASLEEARLEVSMLVSREVDTLNKTELYKTLAETLSENFTDAFVAPFFWLVALGPVGLWGYKASSTADSMWGYKHEPWVKAGFAAARLDDILAFIPARLSVCFLYFGSTDKSGWPGLKKVMQQARLMDSPNAGWSMATAAWLHKASMGGMARYAGRIKNKPQLGPDNLDWTYDKILALLDHLFRSGLIAALALWGVFSIVLLCLF